MNEDDYKQFEKWLSELDIIDLSEEKKAISAKIRKRISKEYKGNSREIIKELINKDIAFINRNELINQFIFTMVTNAIRSYSTIAQRHVQQKLLSKIDHDQDFRLFIQQALNKSREAVMDRLGKWEKRARDLPLQDFLAFCYLLQEKPVNVLPRFEEILDDVLLNTLNSINNRRPTPDDELDIVTYSEGSYTSTWETISKMALACLKHFEEDPLVFLDDLT